MLSGSALPSAAMSSAALRRSRGFTLIEMLVVLALVGILAMSVRPVLELTVQRQKEFALREALRTLRQAIDAYKRAADSGVIMLGPDVTGYPPNLNVLVAGIPDAKSPMGKKIYFLRRIPRDPFASSSLTANETWGIRSYGSPPDAPRYDRDVYDVYSRAAGRALDGSLYADW